MAGSWSSSGSSGSGSGGAPHVKHEVFLSFRGEDTRKTFTSHLHAALNRHDIRTYIDNKLQRGDEISATLLRAIEDAQLSVIVFSKNFATSKWCLDEVVKILECRKRNGQVIVPIFYDIDPSEVRNQTGSYAIAFAKHERTGNMKVQTWRQALTEAANYSGWDCTVNRLESEIVDEIAKDVLQKLNRVYTGDLDHQIAKLEQLARLQEEYFRKIPTPDKYTSQKATVQRVTELQMERDLRLLRVTPDMLAHTETSQANDFGLFSPFR